MSVAHYNLERIGGWMRGKLYGGGGLLQREFVGNQAADIESAREDQPRDFFL